MRWWLLAGGEYRLCCIFCFGFLILSIWHPFDLLTGMEELS
jgi:hypothetical protein